MGQPQFADYSDTQLETLRDDLARGQFKVRKRVALLGISFGIAFVIALPIVPVKILIAVPPFVFIAAAVMLAPAFGMGARRADVLDELQSRGAVVGTPVSPFTGQIDWRTEAQHANELDRVALRRLRVPGIGAAFSLELAMCLSAAAVITDASEGSWLFTGAFIVLAALAVFFIWTIVVAASIGQFKR